MDEYPVSIHLSPSTLERWQDVEHADWLRGGQPDRHSYPILARRRTLSRLESEAEALRVFHSAMTRARWWETGIHPDTAAAIRECGRRIVEETELWKTKPEVIVGWAKESYRRLRIELLPAVKWQIRSANKLVHAAALLTQHGQSHIVNEDLVATAEWLRGLFADDLYREALSSATLSYPRLPNVK